MKSRGLPIQWHRDRGGQAVVELALSLPLLVALLVVSIDLGRAFFYNVIVVDAAEQGARQGSKTPTQDSRIAAAATQSGPAGVLSATDVAVSGSRTSGEAITVTVRYDFAPVTPYLGAILGNPIVVRRSATMRVH